VVHHDGSETYPDLVFRVELWGFELQTSCMPCGSGQLTVVHPFSASMNG
jgi:hypothetical protein